MSKKSNINGRCLEYYLTSSLIKNRKINIQPTIYTQEAQKRDICKLNDLNIQKKQRFERQATKFTDWVIETVIDKNYEYEVARTKDNDIGVDDIKIFNTSSNYLFSIKNNNESYKHQRSPSLLQSIGFNKNTYEDILYRKKYENLKFSIFKEIGKTKDKKITYAELGQEFIFKRIYSVILGLIYETYKPYQNNKYSAQHLFNFLTGGNGHFKCNFQENKKESIKILDFTGIPSTDSFICNLNNDSHMNIAFSNNWIFDLRLHNADKIIPDSLSLKFDTKCLMNPDINSFKI